jgi:hypothetical protein
VSVKIGAEQGGPVHVTAELENFSGKTITAYAVTFIAGYADGVQREQSLTEDILGETVLSRVPGVTVPTSAGTLNPHEVRPVKMSLPLGAGALPPVSATARVTMIIFEDRTAVGDPHWIQTVFDGRRTSSQQDEALLTELRELLARPEIRRSGEPEQTSALREALAGRIAELRSAGVSAGWTEGQLTKLQLFQDALLRSRQHFDQMMSHWDILQRAASEQSKLEVTAQ